jgi:sugar/nucleoside kinase (ribokinase family)
MTGGESESPRLAIRLGHASGASAASQHLPRPAWTDEQSLDAASQSLEGD